MGFLGKLFGKKEKDKAEKSGKLDITRAAADNGIPPEKVCWDSQFDESGLAKRVAKALDEAGISDNVGLWVAQTDSTVVLKYNPDAESVLSKAEQQIAERAEERIMEATSAVGHLVLVDPVDWNYESSNVKPSEKQDRVANSKTQEYLKYSTELEEIFTQLHDADRHIAETRQNTVRLGIETRSMLDDLRKQLG